MISALAAIHAGNLMVPHPVTVPGHHPMLGGSMPFPQQMQGYGWPVAAPPQPAPMPGMMRQPGAEYHGPVGRHVFVQPLSTMRRR